jgi:Transposase
VLLLLCTTANTRLEMKRMGWAGRAPAPNDSESVLGAFQEKKHHHASHDHRSRSDRHRHRYGKNTLHMIGLDARGAIVLREKVSRGRIALRFANMLPCLIGIEAGLTTHYVARDLVALGHDVKQVPPAYAKPFRQVHKNDFRGAHAVAEAVQRPTTRFVPAKTDEQLDLQALHRVRSRQVSGRTAVINQIRGFLLERGIIVRQGLRFLRQALPDILAKRTDVLSRRTVQTSARRAACGVGKMSILCRSRRQSSQNDALPPESNRLLRRHRITQVFVSLNMGCQAYDASYCNVCHFSYYILGLRR